MHYLRAAHLDLQNCLVCRDERPLRSMLALLLSGFQNRPQTTADDIHQTQLIRLFADACCPP